MNPKMPLEPELRSFQTFPQTDTFGRFRKWIRRRATELSRYDAQWRYPRSTGYGFRSYCLSVRASRFSVRRRHRLSVCSRLLFTFDAVAGESEKQAPFGSSLANSVPRALFPMEQTDWWLPRVRGAVFSGVSLRLVLVIVWQGFPLGRARDFSDVYSESDGCFAALHCGIFRDWNGDFHLLRQLQNRTHRRFYRLGVRSVDCDTRLGFLAAKFIAPTQTSQSVYLEKTAAIRDNFNAGTGSEKNENAFKTSGKTVTIYLPRL